MISNRLWTLPVTGALMSLTMLWAGPGFAQQGTCLNDSARKVCLQLSSQPATSVQASKLDGVTDTYVYYTATLTNVALPTSSRLLDVTFTLSPAVTIVDFASTGQCAVNGAVLTCQYDKFQASQDEVITLTATSPQYAGAATPATLVNTGVFGWNGRTGTVSKTLAVTTSGGATWVPPGETVVLVTDEENPDPSLQTTPGKPLFAKMTITAPVDEGFEASLAIDDSTDEDFALSCSGGLFFSGNSDGGPYVCRDIGAPFDAGLGARWVTASISNTDLSFAANPVQLLVIWDDTIVQAAQLDPTALSPTGTPPLAIFYHAQEPVGGVGTNPIRAFGKTCDSNPPPCIGAVQKYGTSDWTATLQLAQFHDDSQADPLTPQTLLEMLSGLMDSLVGLANADLFDKPVIIK